MVRHSSLLLIALLIPTLLTPATGAASTTSRSGSSNCYTLYFLNSIEVFNTSYSGVLYLETPQNISFGAGLEQRVYIAIHSRDLSYDNSTHYMRFELRKGQHFFGYFVAKVVLCGVNTTRVSELEARILVDPFAFTSHGNASMPKDVAKFLKKPPRIVVDKLRPAFEEWFEKLLGYPPTRFSKSVVALYAAEFIKSWIRYSPSPYPRTLKEIIDERIGDCDDMSRALIALLWSYGIPAVMAVGYVVLWNLTYTVPVESTLYVFHNSGPHAFVLAYSPDTGWIPIDFLAGSLTSNLFVFEGYTTQVRVNKTEVQQFKNVSKEIKAVQIFYVFNPSQFSLVSKNLLPFLRKLYRPYEERYERSRATQTAAPPATSTSVGTTRSTTPSTSTSAASSTSTSSSSVATTTSTSTSSRTGSTTTSSVSISRPLEASKTSVATSTPTPGRGTTSRTTLERTEVKIMVLSALILAIIFAALLLRRSAKH